MKKLILIALLFSVLAINVANATVVCNTWGNSTYCNDNEIKGSDDE